MLIVAIDVEVVGIDGGDDAHVWRQLEERVVELIGFHHHEVVSLLAYHHVAVDVACNATDERRQLLAGCHQYMCHEGSGGGLAMGACYREGFMLLREHAEHLGAFQDLYASALQIIQLQRVSRDGRRQHHKVNILRDKARVINIMNADAFLFETACQRRRCLVVTRHFIALGLEISCQGAHPDATDS